MPYWFASVIAAIKGTRELKLASEFMAAFEKIGEWGDPSEANDLFEAPRIKLDDWLSGTGPKKQKMPAADQGSS